jgi:ADP-heptose:LPS heptosyltransferase
MPKRKRWTPVRGTANRIYDPGERLLLGALDLPGRVLSALVPRRKAAPLGDPRSVLVLRLDRIGDLLMSLPALSALRRALPKARIRLAVGRWGEDIARTAPVDEILVWSAPWAGRAREGAESLLELLRKAWSLRADPPDLALDLQGDVRAALVMALTGAKTRVGYANTGGAYLLTHVVPLDETVSWVEQNLRAVGLALGAPVLGGPVDPLTPEERAARKDVLSQLGLEGRRPLVGIHPSGGRSVKEWDLPRWGRVGRRLSEAFGATLVVTGGEGDRALAAALLLELPGAFDLAGRLTLRETLALIASLDLFLSPDTGPMHMACAVGTPSVAVFGPTDPVRYFSGADGTARHVVVRHDLWCSPCNLVRRPPKECVSLPECLRLVTDEDVFSTAARLLRQGGFVGPGGISA